MFESIRNRISFSNVIAMIALFVALGGSAYAVKKISTKQLKNNAVKTKKIAPNAVTSPKIAPNAVTNAKVADLNFQPLDFLNGWEAGDPGERLGPARCRNRRPGDRPPARSHSGSQWPGAGMRSGCPPSSGRMGSHRFPPRAWPSESAAPRCW